MEIRPYAETDAPATLSVFLAAVTETASVHYSAEQIAAWARPDERDVNQWNSARKSLNTYVATIGAEVAGFSDVGDDGYIDMMFVAPKFGRRGVAGALLAQLHDIAVGAGASELYTSASITARPFFEQQGFAVVAEQNPITLGVEMTNYKMMLHLCRRSSDFLWLTGGRRGGLRRFDFQALPPHGAGQHEHHTEDAVRAQNVAGQCHADDGRPNRLGPE
jgi:putative acetyltransferase